MPDPYVGELKIFAGTFAPAGWMFCKGQLIPISDYDMLFNLIGTTYGGDGQSTFALPDLQGRVPVHTGSGYYLGQEGGVESVTLNTGQLPAHSHTLAASGGAGAQNPSKAVLATSVAVDLYRESSASVMLAPNSIGSTGGTKPHENLQPYLCVNFIISMFGNFPYPG